MWLCSTVIHVGGDDCNVSLYLHLPLSIMSKEHKQIVRWRLADDFLYFANITVIILGLQRYRLSSTTKCGKTLQIRQIRDS